MICGKCKHWDTELIVNCQVITWLNKEDHVVTYSNAPISTSPACPAFAEKVTAIIKDDNDGN